MCIRDSLFPIASHDKYGGHRLSLHHQLNNSVSKLEETGPSGRLNFRSVQRNLLAKTGSLPGVNIQENNSVERAVRSTADKNIVISDLGGSIETPNRAVLLATRGSQGSIGESEKQAGNITYGLNRTRVSPLKALTHKEDLVGITRKHNITMNGHIGHGRNLT